MKREVENFADNLVSNFVDFYQCKDWGINAKTLAILVIDDFTELLTRLAVELDEQAEDE